MKNKTFEYFKDMTKWYYEKQMGLYEKVIELLQNENVKYRFVYDDTTSPKILMSEEDFFGYEVILLLSANDHTFKLHLDNENDEKVLIVESTDEQLIVNCIKSLHMIHHLGRQTN